MWPDTQGRVEDVLAPKGDEGRGRLRKARGSCQTSVDPGIPELLQSEFIGLQSERGELKHLSTHRKRKQERLPE